MGYTEVRSGYMREDANAEYADPCVKRMREVEIVRAHEDTQRGEKCADTGNDSGVITYISIANIQLNEIE